MGVLLKQKKGFVRLLLDIRWQPIESNFKLSRAAISHEVFPKSRNISSIVS